MRLETVRNEYNNGLLTFDEAVTVIAAIGKSVDFARRYLNGCEESDMPFVEGVSRRSVLVFRDMR